MPGFHLGFSSKGEGGPCGKDYSMFPSVKNDVLINLIILGVLGYAPPYKIISTSETVSAGGYVLSTRMGNVCQ